MKEYTKASIFYPYSASINHSRGCIGNCKFCSCWIHMAKHKLKNGEVKRYPKYRSESPEKTVEKVDLLVNKYGVEGLVWVDDTFNLDPEWNRKFSELIIERGLDKLHWWAFLRADFIVRGEKLGIFEKMYRAGLEHALIGVERSSALEREKVSKSRYSQQIVKKAFKILREKYPNIFIQATFLTGTREETRESMLKLLEYAKDLGVDYPSFYAITPNPGTDLWYEAKEKGWIEVDDFRQYDWF
ncbi:MAG: radical SAM protein [Promethearchaeia archaeon]